MRLSRHLRWKERLRDKQKAIIREGNTTVIIRNLSNFHARPAYFISKRRLRDKGLK